MSIAALGIHAMERFRKKREDMIKIFRERGKDEQDMDVPDLVVLVEQLETLVTQCVGTSTSPAIRRRTFNQRLGTLHVTRALFAMNNRSLEKQGGFDTIVRIQTLEAQMAQVVAQLSNGPKANHAVAERPISQHVQPESEEESPRPSGKARSPNSLLQAGKTDPNQRRILKRPPRNNPENCK